MSTRVRCGKPDRHPSHWWKSGKFWCDGKVYKPTVKPS